MLKKFFLSFLMIIFFIQIFSQEASWSLERCVQYALENNIQIKQQELNAEYNNNKLTQSKYGLLPDLNLGASHGYSFGRALDETTYEFTDNETVRSNNVGIRSSVTLFSGFQNINTIKQNEFDLQASLKDVEQIKNNVSLTIASAFLNILFNEELVTISYEQLELTKQQVERTEKLLEAGSVARGRLLEIQAQAASEELRLINAQNQLDISYLTLIQLLELDSVADFQIDFPSNLSIDQQNTELLSIDAVYNQSLTALPQIKSAEFRLKSAEKGLDIAKGMRYPSLSFNGTYGSVYSSIRSRQTGLGLSDPIDIGNTQSGEIVFGSTPIPILEDYPFMDQMNDNISTTLTFNLSIPVFNKYMVKNNVDNAKIGILNSQLELENQKNILYKDIQQAYANAIAAFKKYQATEKALTAMEESFRYTQEKYEVGLVNTVDYNAAKNQLAQTESDLLQAKYEYIFKTKILDFYRGIPIKL
ncbi:TolC family protein [Bacteroidota bacterium]